MTSQNKQRSENTSHIFFGLMMNAGTNEKKKRKNRRGLNGRMWKPFHQMTYEEKKDLRKRQERKAELRELEGHSSKIPVNAAGEVAEGTAVFDYMPPAPKVTTQVNILFDKIRIYLYYQCSYSSPLLVMIDAR